ncbi:MFS general substrate transporter [Tothia fuscella]|uniref:MFS general substrate transporter n=1 Tax=Tothia fuscella TaxID=1048955 RepID=A0A9P4NZJ2_9PEZI|nr:MFS general substrate transporter [Tothia fuscella]
MFMIITTIGGLLHMLGTGKRILAERYHVDFPVAVKYIAPPGIIANAIALFFASAIAAVWGKRIGILLGRARLMSLSSFVHVIGPDAAHVVAGNIIEKLGIKYLYIVTFSVMAPLVLCIFFFMRETTFVRRKPALPFNITCGDFETKKDEESNAGEWLAHLNGIDENKSKTVVTIDIRELSHSTISNTSDITPSTDNGALDVNFETRKDEESNADEKKPKDFVKVAIHELSHSATSSTSDIAPSTDNENGALDIEHTFRQNLRIYRGRVTTRNFFLAFLQPFPLMLFPTIMFATVLNGAFTTWAMMNNVAMNQVLLYEPYNLTPSTMAYIGLPGSIIGLLSAVCAACLSDWLVKNKMAKRNEGVYEPEYRLLLLIPAVLFSTLAFTLLGPAFASQASIPKIVGLGLFFHMAVPFAHSACVTYIFDTKGDSATEAFVASGLAKHVFMWACTMFVPTWFAGVGPVQCYRTLAVLNVCFAVVGVPMYVFGKRLRGFCARNKFLATVAGN